MNDPLQPKNPSEQGEVKAKEAIQEGQLANLREEKGGALLEVQLPPLNQQIELQGKRFVLKSEFHVTLVGFAAKLDKKTKEAAAARGESISNSEALERVKAAIKKAGEGKNFSVTFSPETRRAIKGDSETIIKMCEVEGVSEFFQAVESELGLPAGSIEVPPTHVTVYTLENGKGIGLANQAQLNEFTVPLGEAELDELRQVALAPLGTTQA